MNKKVLTLDYHHNNYILRDHTFYDIRIIPGVTYLDVVLRAAKAVFKKDFLVEKILFIQPLVTTEAFGRKLEISFTESKTTTYDVLIRSKRMNSEEELFGDWTNHMSCRLDEEIENGNFPKFEVNAFIENSKMTFGMDEIYTKMKTIDIRHGEFMKTHGKLYQNDDEELMQLRLSNLAEEYRDQFIIHPAFLDSATLAGSSFKLNVGDEVRTNGVPYIPFSVDKFIRFKAFPEIMYVYSKKQNLPSDSLPEVISNDIWVYNEEGEILAYFENLVSKRVREPESIKKLLLQPKLAVIEPIKKQASIQNGDIGNETDLITKIRSFLKDIIAKRIGGDSIDLDEELGFYDMGLDSVTIQEVMKELEEVCQRDFDPTLPFEYQTIKDLADFLHENEGEHFLTLGENNDKINTIEIEETSSNQFSPLLHQVINKENYKTVFRGKESFFIDHKILGEKMLPGVAYIEMARQAGKMYFDSANIELRNLRWLVPIKIADTELEIQVRIFEEKKRTVFQIFSVLDNQIHCKGEIDVDVNLEPERFDLNEIKRQEFQTINNYDFYQKLKEKGFEYGKSFQGIQELYYNKKESLGRISLPKHKENYMLSPGAMDSALHACIGLVIQQEMETMSIPYGVKTIEIYKELPNEFWSYVKKNERKGTIKSYDIYILNDDGELLVKIKDFIALPIPEESIKKENNGITYRPIWDKLPNLENESTASKNIILVTGRGQLHKPFIQHLRAILTEQGAVVSIFEKLPIIDLENQEVYLLNGLFPMGDGIAFEASERIIFETIKQIQNSYHNKSLKLTVLTLQTTEVEPTDSCRPYGGGISGLMGSVGKEETHWELRTIDIDTLELSENDQRKITRFSYSYGEETIALRKSSFYRQNLHPVSLNTNGITKLKKGGVYVLLGGAGGIGQVTSAYLIKNFGAKIVWLGRSPLSSKIKEAQEELSQYGTKPLYISCDANSLESMENGYRQVKAIYNRIDGLFHSAIVLKTNLLAHMTGDDFDKSYLPKSKGTHNFIEPFKNDNLDFICFYSSIQSQWSAKGLANYASGSTYKDNYGRFVMKQMGIPCYIINWGYWGDSGVASSTAHRKRMEFLGIGSINATKGMEILEQVLRQNTNQIVAIELNGKLKERIYERLNDKKTTPAEINYKKNKQEKIKISKKNSNYNGKREPIAIIGMSGKYPEANNLNELWNNLKQGKDSITRVPLDRKELIKNKENFDWGGFVNDIYEFDPLFFQISPRVAKKMDPQGRLFLEESWKALEDSGYPPKKIEGKEKVGVFAGVFWTDYQLYRTLETESPTFPMGGVSLIPNTVSSCLGLTGPSIGIDTQCSSSVMAIHMACDSIRNGDSTMAIAGGVNLTLHSTKYDFLLNSMFLSSKGRCESFGEGGDGYVPGEGVGALILKSLSAAEADGDRIYGVIRGTAINHDGKGSGFTVPNPNAQSAVIKEAMERAGVKPEDFSYIEAHGTGTKLGDPIEITGLSNAFSTTDKQYCRIGSIKSNIGHTEANAGIAGVTKVLLQMKYKQLVPSIHSTILNKRIDFEKSPFKVQQKLTPWVTEKNKPRLAGVNSFGAGGSNGHIIIEEYLGTKTANYKTQGPEIIMLSAKNIDRLKTQVSNLKEYLIENPAIPLSDVAYTLIVSRDEMRERLIVIVNDKKELIKQLSEFEKGNQTKVFTGNIKNHDKIKIPNNLSKEEYAIRCLQKKNYEILAQLWTNGVKVEWLTLYGDNKQTKISLPNYPFARDICRLYEYDENGNVIDSTKVSINKAPLSVPKEALLQQQWVSKPLKDEYKNIEDSEGLIIIAGGVASLGEKIKEQLVAEVEVLNDERQFLNKVIKKISTRINKTDALSIKIIYENQSYLNYGFVTGALEVITKHYPNIQAKVIGVESLSITRFEELVTIIEDEDEVSGKIVRYVSGKREVKTLLPTAKINSLNSNESIHQKGTYIFLGEMGMLEKQLAKDFQKEKQVEIIGINSTHCNFSVKEELKTVFSQVKQRYPVINGVICSRFLFNEAGNLELSFTKKIEILKTIEEFVIDKSLDFIVFLSELNKRNENKVSNGAFITFIDVYAETFKTNGKIQSEIINLTIERKNDRDKKQIYKNNLKQFGTKLSTTEFNEIISHKSNLNLPLATEVETVIS